MKNKSFLLIFFLLGCRQDMMDQPKYEPSEASSFFKDGRADRALVEDTVARGQLNSDPLFFEGKQNGHLTAELPFPVTKGLLERGRERYDIYCSVCHDRLGTGNGMIVRRDFPAPPSFHLDRLREAPVGHFFDVMTNGYGTMYSYADRVPPADRWAIAVYIRALQRSQHASLADVPTGERAALQEKKR